MWGKLALSIFCATLVSAVVLREKPTVHESFSKKELGNIFGTEDQDKVPTYQLAKVKRHAEKLLPVSLKLNAFGTELRLNLSVGQDFIAHGHTIEFYGANGKVEKYYGTPGEFSTGKVFGDDDSHVALHHNENGVIGSVKTKKDMFFIHALPARLQNNEADHLVYRRTELPESHPLHNFGCGMKENIVEEAKNVAKRSRKRRAVTGQKTIELMVAADYKMVEHYSKLFLPTYMLAVMNIMAGMFKDPSLEVTIDIRVTRTVIFETDQFKAGTIGQLLANFHSWFLLNNDAADSNPSHVDNAIMLTRDGCTDGCKLEGLAYTSLCGNRAQSVSKDRGLMTAATAAHELAHNLGVGHDTTAECPDGYNIMTTGSAQGTTIFQWSKCSSDQIKSAMESSASSCMDDAPAEHRTNSSFQLYGHVYDATKQCEFAKGSDFSACSYIKSCSQLHCQQQGQSSCTILSYPAVHGTPCGEHKHCIQGVCVPDGTTPENPIDGQWGEWSGYTTCNRKCGMGVQWRERKCDNPARKYGGKKCEGETKGLFKTCNTHTCPDGTAGFRLQQCQNISGEFKDFYDASRPCQLVCGTISSAYYYGTVLDATPCAPGVKGSLCIQGTCKPYGCDLELESGNVIDRCGVCKGLGNACELVTGTDMNTYNSQGEYHLIDVPAGSTSVKIKELGGTFNFIGFKIGTSSQLAIPLPTYSVTYYLEGVPIYYSMEGYYYPDEITVMSALPEGIRAYLVNYYLQASQGVTWTFYKPVDNTTVPVQPVFVLIGGAWGTCSQTCGGGKQTRSLTCIRQDDNSTVSVSSCENLEGPVTEQSCNTNNCPAQWHVTAWTKCSKSCGKGTKTRQLYCSKIDGTGKRVAAPDTECSEYKPEVDLTSNCNEVICPAFYEYGEWSQCSASCGGGQRSRTAKCKYYDGAGKLVTANSLACNYLSEPLVTETCNADVPCPEWKVIYSECSKTCGGGIQTASVACVDPENDNHVDESGCDASKKITVTEKDNKICNEELCNPYIWKNKEGVCSVTCGKGLRSVTVTCYGRAEDATVDNSKCPTPKPETPEPLACDAGICPETYAWKTKYGACSVTCGEGTKNLEPYCVRESDQAVVDDMFCEASTKPSITTSPCVLEKCPTVYLWKVGFADCSVTCGEGIKKAVFTCSRENDKVVVDNSNCDVNTKPTAEDKKCDLGQCPPTYFWLSRNSSCSVTCGTGLITESAQCHRDVDRTIMADSFCDASKKLATKRYECVRPECLSLYYWKANFGKCMAKCGSGHRLKVLTCMKRSGEYVVENSNCLEMPVPSDEPCTTEPCKPVFNSTKMPPVYPIGCYNDQPTPRRVPIYLGSMKELFNPDNPAPLIEKCAEKAHSMGYVYFSTQFYGECWAGDVGTAERYYLNGHARNCINKIGGDASNFVYKIGSPEVLPAVPALIKIGCFNDDITYPRPIPVRLDNFRDLVNWDEDNFDNIVTMCAQSTLRRNWKIFGIQYYGECWSGENAKTTYNRAGTSDRCQGNVVGVINANYVYAMLE